MPVEMKYTKTVTILPSQLNPEGQLGLAHTFDLFMDTATEAAGAMGVGWDFLKKKGLFWITVKARVRFIKPPMMLETVEVSTWPEQPGEKRCNRDYAIRRDGELLATGKTEWAIVSMLTHRPQSMAKVLPQGLTYPEERVSPEPFPMIDEAFADPPYHEHRVDALDIDMARHMNNVAYVRAIMNSFTTKEWRKLNVTQMDIIFIASAVEGDVLRLQKREAGDHIDIRGSIAGGRTSVLARLTRG